MASEPMTRQAYIDKAMEGVRPGGWRGTIVTSEPNGALCSVVTEALDHLNAEGWITYETTP